MKAIFLTSVFAALILSTNVDAKNVKTYINMDSNEFGVKKEYISIDIETSKPLTKEFYDYDSNNNIIEKTISKWDEKTGWKNCGKYEYNYFENGKVANITFTEWDNQKSIWSEKSNFLIHLYNENGDFLSVKQIEIDNNSDYNLVSLK